MSNVNSPSNSPSSTFVRIARNAHASQTETSENTSFAQALINKNETAVQQAILKLKEEGVSRLPSEIIQTIQNALMVFGQDSVGLEVKEKLFEILLKQEGFDINAPIAYGETLLDAAQRHGAQAFVDILLKKGAIFAGKIAQDDNRVRLASGLSSGLSVATLMPWARVTFMSAYEKTPFLSSLNFNNLYRGFSQVIVTKTLSSGLYFPFYEIFYDGLKPVTGNEPLRAAVAGYAAGIGSGVLFNGLHAIRYQCFQTKNAFLPTVKMMWRCGGMAPFIYGVVPTIVRDAVFGGVYGVSQHCAKNTLDTQNPSTTILYEHVGNVTSGCIAAVAAAPLHYARNLALATPPGSSAPSIYASWRQLFQQAAASSHPIKTVVQALNIGPGTLRAGLGIYVGGVLYDTYKNWFLKAG